MLYNANGDLVNDNVYTKFCLILSIHSQDIKQKTDSEVNQVCHSLAKLQRNDALQS